MAIPVPQSVRMERTHDDRLRAARLSLEGLSVGDAVGNQIELEEAVPPWRYSDDTEMAIAIVETLGVRGAIDHTRDRPVRALGGLYPPARLSGGDDAGHARTGRATV